MEYDLQQQRTESEVEISSKSLRKIAHSQEELPKMAIEIITMAATLDDV